MSKSFIKIKDDGALEAPLLFKNIIIFANLLNLKIMAKAVNDANFAEVINSEIPVVVDFWATWCGPCKAIAPIIDELAVEFEGKVLVCKCNVDECDDVPMDYGIRSIPTVLFFKGGEVVDRHVGAATKDVFAAKINALL